MSASAVRFSDVWKRFRLGESHDSLAELLASAAGRLLGKAPREKKKTFWALQGVDFAVERGEALGIIGPNGAGKSTTLKLLAGILRPERGSISVDGRLAALIEVGAGFHGDLTGRENIFLNGAIMGMERSDIRKKLDDIVSFAGIERFLDMPVKRYSSGMYARLGFSIAAHVDPDVLLVDEVLSVGDAVFRLRCMDRMSELIRGGTTLVFVTHNLDQMQSICKQAVVIDGGKTVYAGPSRDAVGHYLSAMSQAYGALPTDVTSDESESVGCAELLNLRFSDDRGKEVVWSRSDAPLKVHVGLRLNREIRKAVVELNMRANVSENLVSVNSGRDGITFPLEMGENHLTLALPALPVSGGQYFWNVRVWDTERGTTELDTPFKFPLVLDDEGKATGALCIEHNWEHKSTLSTTTDPQSTPEVALTVGEPS